jgi:hypothetical protein
MGHGWKCRWGGWVAERKVWALGDNQEDIVKVGRRQAMQGCSGMLSAW